MTAYVDAVTYGNRDIVFHVYFTTRNSMEIAVHPDTTVVVKAPVNTSKLEIRMRVYRRARWIKKQISYFQQFNPRTPQREYISGETHLYLGRQYRLKVAEANDARVKLTRGYILINCRDKQDTDNVRSHLEEWYLQKARIKFMESVDCCFPDFKHMGFSQPGIHIRRMKTRWGSLSSTSTLTLNRDLIRAPRQCIDYVVTHELCHLQYNDHSRAFYRLLEQLMPDWEKRKHRLELALI